MSGDVTYQSLKRLSWLPQRDASDNGSVIAGQEYDDVLFVGGTISNVTLSGVTISGLSAPLAPEDGGTGIANTGTITLGGDFATSGAFTTTLTVTGDTNVTLPTTGTLATLDGTENLTNKTITSGNYAAGGSMDGTFSGNHTYSGQVTFSNVTAPIITTTVGRSASQQHTVPAVASDTFALLAASQTMTNKTLTSPTITVMDNAFTLQDDSDPSKQAKFQLSGISTATTRTLTLQNNDYTIAGINIAQTYTGLQTFSNGINLGNTTLSNYLQSTYVPVVSGQTIAGVGTYTLQTGVYTRVGNLVTVVINLGWSAHTGTGNMVVSLPIAAAALPGATPCAVYQSGLNVGAGLQFAAQVVGGTSNILLYANNPAGAASILAIDTSVAELRLQVTYFV